ncbi:MAG TPA: sigma-70 family RNA polymerase sigma factor [Gemmatimonadales bacterium]|jgi:RNA polymerase sigma-70 factor (ECF subfamily)|nr:sigma-70 family RNA polymerase sigma factor [Gemmatimonadales bacterium]
MTDPAADRSAFEAEVLPQLDSLYRLGLRLTTDPSRAEDLVQDTVLKAFRSWQRFQPGTNIRSWLFTILRNTFINDYRRRQREPIPMDLEAVEPHAAFRAAQDEDPEGAFFSQIVDAKVLNAIDALPEEFREVLVLSDIENLPYAEIAEVLGVPVGTVKSRLFRARRQLQEALYDHAVEMGYIRARDRAPAKP